MESESPIANLSVNDVKPGAGNYNHPGNKIYLQLVDKKKKEFVLAGQDLNKRDVIVRQIYKEIQVLKPSGRFLKNV